MPKLLDLCCGCGGGSEGYAQAGFAVTGVDLQPQPNYRHTTPYLLNTQGILASNLSVKL